jgi:hypothetical protein
MYLEKVPDLRGLIPERPSRSDAEEALHLSETAAHVLPMCFPIAFSGKQSSFEWLLST